MSSEAVTRRSLLTGGAGLAFAPAIISVRTKTTGDPLTWTLNEAADHLAQGVISSEELTKLCLARIHKLEPRLNAVITLQEETALAQAREYDQQRAAGRAVGRFTRYPRRAKGQH